MKLKEELNFELKENPISRIFNKVEYKFKNVEKRIGFDSILNAGKWINRNSFFMWFFINLNLYWNQNNT